MEMPKQPFSRRERAFRWYAQAGLSRLEVLGLVWGHLWRWRFAVLVLLWACWETFWGVSAHG